MSDLWLTGRYVPARMPLLIRICRGKKPRRAGRDATVAIMAAVTSRDAGRPLAPKIADRAPATGRRPRGGPPAAPETAHPPPGTGPPPPPAPAGAPGERAGIPGAPRPRRRRRHG